jgi:ferredoxin-NADP reductase
MLQPWQKATVISIQQVTPNTRSFFLQANELSSFAFKPGQFVTLDLPIHEQKNKRWRSYSIASIPNNSNVFELVIVLLEGGAGTNYLFNEVVVGSELTFRGPAGVFTLPDNLQHDVFFICTGTGIAPFRGMSHQLLQQNFAHRIHLIFGCRRQEDVLYQQEFLQLQQQNSNFTYTICFSQEQQVQTPNIQGYVHKGYEQLLHNRIGNQQFFLCGWKNMIDEAKLNLLAMGFDKKQIHIEIYG